MNGVVEILELKKGDLVKEKIEEFVIEKGWKEAYVMSALGSMVNVKLTNAASFEIPPKIETTELKGHFEALSFTGEVSINENNEAYVHIHASGSLTNSEARGGGLLTAEVFRGLKIYIQKIK